MQSKYRQFNDQLHEEAAEMIGFAGGSGCSLVVVIGFFCVYLIYTM